MAFGSVAKSAFHVSSAKLWEKVKKVNKTIIISFGTLMEFFLTLVKKELSGVSKQKSSVQREKRQRNSLEKMVFRLFWTSTRKSCLPKLLSTCAEEHLQSNISERKSWKLEDFWIIFEVFGTMAENLFEGWQNNNRCPGEEFMEKFLTKRETFAFFLILSKFLLLPKNFAWFAKPAICVSVEVFGKIHFFHFIYSLTLLWNLIPRTLSQKIFPGLSRGIFLGKVSFFWKKSYICSSVLEFEQFFAFRQKKTGCQRNNLLTTSTEKTWRKKFVEKLFLK